MRITREQLERTLDELRAEVPDPRVGLWGPGTISWRVNRELAVFLAGGRAALLQLAHPFVASAIEQHSNTLHDPLGRFERTFRYVFAMAFGDLDHAISAARRVHAIHQRIYGQVTGSAGAIPEGTRYEATDEAATRWVYATLVDSAVCAYERVVEPLTADERERYYRESFRFAKLFGIDIAALPPDWAAFQDYNRQMWSWLSVGRPAREIGRFLLSDTALRPGPLAAWYRLVTAHWLPEPLRAGFGLPYSRRQRVLLELSLPAFAASYRALPRRMRYQPTYLDARRRLAGKRGRDRIGAWMERNVLHGVIHERA